jgi:hypothetical protein
MAKALKIIVCLFVVWLIAGIRVGASKKNLIISLGPFMQYSPGQYALGIANLRIILGK